MRIFDICFKALLILVLGVIALFLFKITCGIEQVASGIKQVNKNNAGRLLNPIWVHIETFAEYDARIKFLEKKLLNKDKDVPSEEELIKLNNEFNIDE